METVIIFTLIIISVLIIFYIMFSVLKKTKQRAEKAEEERDSYKRKYEALERYERRLSELQSDKDKIQNELSKADNDEEVAGVINNIIDSNNGRMQKSAKK